MKRGESALVLRVLVDRSVIEAFGMDGRGSMTRRAYPKQFNTSTGAALVYHAPASAEPPTATIAVWEMRSGRL